MARLFMAAAIAVIALTGLSANQCSNEEAQKQETAPAEQPAPAPEQPPAQ